ncbi:Lrp/AsnC family transcriptional regulator [Promethearchaeum syntrophicum]|uniref:Lrp/AsnC family transcriptional regulator n=1 Tax=Promethearchaeum syntrophicum TaxID=2594042 RepID=A0A5B9D885_9ARCH|nr:Lrp/AsnC family transcriptional regulator [Candidatus Prometheoarchaeum syntrophicum]QEE15221.1 putative HTH-type transcriptional regulator [Candidatus Prometheoarchaeum syntrophicum]
MDEKDLIIIDALKKDASLSVAKLSLNTNLPSTTIFNRIKKLKDNGIIKNYTINIDKDRVFGNIQGIILIKASNTDQRQIVQKLLEHPSVENAAIMTGNTDIVIRIRVKSIDDLNKFILDYLRKIKGIQDSTTMISLEYYEKN